MKETSATGSPRPSLSPRVRRVSQEKITDSPFLDILGYLKNTHKNPKFGRVTSPNQGTWLGISWLGLVSLCQIWDFYGYSLNTQKYPKMGIRYFFLCLSPITSFIINFYIYICSHFVYEYNWRIFLFLSLKTIKYSNEQMETEAAYAAKGSTLRLCSYMYHIGLFELELFELYEFSLFQAIRWWTAGEKFRSLFSQVRFNSLYTI